MSAKVYYADKHGEHWISTTDWDQYCAWLDKNYANLLWFQLYTSDMDASFTSDGFDKTLESYDPGFTEEEEDIIEEDYGILV